MIAVRRLVKHYPEAFAYWRRYGKDIGILERAPVAKTARDGSEYQAYKHKHGVLGHQLGGAIFAGEIGAWLQKSGHLTSGQVRETVLANLIHDADKTTDMALIIMAMGGRDGQEDVSWSLVEQIVRGTDLNNQEQILKELRADYEGYFHTNVGVGERVHVARALVAGRIHKERLAQAGFSPVVIDIQGATEYTGCNEVEPLIDGYDQLSPEEEVRAVQKLIVSYVDNGMRESELVDVRNRTVAVFKKPINIALSEAYRQWNELGETAEAKQIRVGRKTEAFLARLVGTEPTRFLPELEARVQSWLCAV